MREGLTNKGFVTAIVTHIFLLLLLLLFSFADMSWLFFIPAVCATPRFVAVGT
jgi:hypothetical protein